MTHTDPEGVPAATSIFTRPDRQAVVTRIEMMRDSTKSVEPIREPFSGWLRRHRRGILRLTNIKDHLRTLRNLTRTRYFLRDTGIKLAQTQAALAEEHTRIEALAAQNKDLHDSLARMESSFETSLGHAAKEIARLGAVIDAQRRSYVEITRRLETRAKAPASARKAGPTESDPFLDIFYREFEDRYRGSREEILLRLRPYLSDLNFLKGSREKDRRIVDLGCGRGEWLEVLREDGIDAIGVDLNSAQTDAARQLGLEIEIDDIISWISRQKDRSIDFISAFHVIEHLPFPVLVRLLKEALRTIKPGGGLLLETPNPESLIVGAYKFWLDPTHVRPYPPELITQLLESLGFNRIDLLRLHPDGRNADYKLQHGLAAPVADLLAGPLDYAVLCRRP